MTPEHQKLLQDRFKSIVFHSCQQKQKLPMSFEQFSEFMQSSGLLEKLYEQRHGSFLRQINPDEPFSPTNIEMVPKSTPRRVPLPKDGYVQLSVKEWVEALKAERA